MAINKTHQLGRSSSCFRKYRILFLFGITVLCIQIYLAHMFFALEDGHRKVSRPFSGEDGLSQSEEVDGLPKGSRQLKLPPDKQSNSNKSLQSQRNRTSRIKLDHKSLNFTPACEVNGREAISAIARAQSQVCKERIVNVTCLNQQGLLYPETIQSLCPHSLGFADTPFSLGCFRDEKTSRILAGYYHIFKGNNSPKHCAFMCLQSGYPYAGTEYSVECFCGMEEPPQEKHLPDSSCNMKCSGDPKQTCGGYLTINIFWTGIQKFKPQEARNSTLRNVEPVRIAYLLTVNGRASRQVKRLINVLYHPSHLFYIHIDARQDYLYREMLDIEKSCNAKNIKVAKESGLRHASIWGGASLLTTLLKSAEQMLAYDHHWDFLVNLSESDFPIKHNARLVEFLTWNKGLNFVKSHGREVQRFITKQGLDKTFVECEARMWRVGDRKLSNGTQVRYSALGIQIDGGSDWVALSRDFVEYVVNPNPDPLVKDLLKIFRYTLLPAESFFHTVLRNSRYCDTYVDNNLHVTNWKRKLGCKCQYKAVVDWCGCSPNDFKIEDFSRIRNTADRNLFFARKFEPAIDQRIIDRVEEWLYPERANKTTKAKGYDAYWQSLYHHADLSPLTDDALLTVSNSVARLAFQKSLQKISLPQKKSQDVRLLETTAYFRENRFIGILVLAETDGDGDPNSEISEIPNPKNASKNAGIFRGGSRKIEALVYPKRNFSTSKLWLGKIQSLIISTDYDQKEQTFRNLLGSIGPYATPILSYEFDVTVTTPLNLTLLWINPYGKLEDISYVHLEETSLIGHIRPQLKEHLVVGTWQLSLVVNSILVAKTNFLVTPLAYWKNKKINGAKAKEVNKSTDTSRSTDHISEETLKELSSVLKFIATSKLPKQIEYSIGAHMAGLDLEKQIDGLVHEHYEVGEICQVQSQSRGAEEQWQNCIDTQWSSLSTDSKADIRNLCQN